MIKIKKYTTLLLLLFSLSHAFAQTKIAKDETLDTLKEGKIKGAILSSSVLAFKGIPYAEAPLGELRWRSPGGLQRKEFP